jgi:hypothetical protein
MAEVARRTAPPPVGPRRPRLRARLERAVGGTLTWLEQDVLRHLAR